MEAYEKFEQLLRQYSYKELSAEDKQVVDRFVGAEEEYESLRAAEQRTHSFFHKGTEISDSPKTWSRIKNSWVRPQRHYWLNTPVPAYATALLLFAVGALGWIGGWRYSIPAQVAIRQTELRIDTVLIRSRPDTVVRERIIYVDRQSQAAPVMQTSHTILPDRPASRGVNMKEKEELENLLVSGSR